MTKRRKPDENTKEEPSGFSRMKSFDNVKESDLAKLKRYGYEMEKPCSKLEAARLLGKAKIVLFKTGKLVIQGKKEYAEEASKLVEFLGITKEKKRFTGPAIGSDESLKGDTFGGIVVAGFRGDDEIRIDLKQMGVRDSKELHNPDIVDLATKLIEKYPKAYHVESLLPKEYNRLNSRLSVTDILNSLHAKCYRCLAGSSSIIHIVDQYPGCNVGNIIETKAESKYYEVAAASIIARYNALLQIRELEKKAGFFIPMGSTHVDASLLEIKKKSLKPEDFVKMKFQNVVRFFA